MILFVYFIIHLCAEYASLYGDDCLNLFVVIDYIGLNAIRRFKKCGNSPRSSIVNCSYAITLIKTTNSETTS